MDLLRFLDDHGNALAAIAALIGIPILILQITQSGRQEKRRIKARRLAAMSTLPMTLSGINAWATAAARSQARVYRWVKRDDPLNAMPPYEPPPSPDHLIAAIERMIEAAPHEPTARTLAAIVAQVQVLWSRTAAIEQFAPTRIRNQIGMIDDNLLMAASIHAHADSLYDEARSFADNAPDDFDRMRSVLNIMELRTGNFDDAHALLGRRAERARMARRRGYEKAWDWLKARWGRSSPTDDSASAEVDSQ